MSSKRFSRSHPHGVPAASTSEPLEPNDGSRTGSCGRTSELTLECHGPPDQSAGQLTKIIVTSTGYWTKRLGSGRLACGALRCADRINLALTFASDQVVNSLQAVTQMSSTRNAAPLSMIARVRGN